MFLHRNRLKYGQILQIKSETYTTVVPYDTYNVQIVQSINSGGTTVQEKGTTVAKVQKCSSYPFDKYTNDRSKKVVTKVSSNLG